ncbi:dihydrodipicolinate synthase family protein [Rouxiella sp. T17]|uniref:dihydrodipicolinate synthase family protein n=1 Tax=Rouxiella sp. T17 TaxID=3085684 RepID=UPI002FCA8EFB
MLKGLCAFPLTPLKDGEIDEKAFTLLIENLLEANVDSIGALGSTGSYAYLTREQRKHATEWAVKAAGKLPVITSIGSVRFEEVLQLADDAQKAGVSGVLMAPVSYQKLRSEEVFELYRLVTRELSVPLCLYDNFSTTGFEFTDELLIELAQLPNMGSIKLGSLPATRDEAERRLTRLRSAIPSTVTLGISGDAQSPRGLLAGCDVWYSVLGGLFPRYTRRLARAAMAGDEALVNRLSQKLDPLWALFARHGSLRVVAAMAEMQGKVQAPCLPKPLNALQGTERALLQQALQTLDELS